MSDPAIEAARRAWAAGATAPASIAREALKPIRAELDRLAEATEPPCDLETRLNEFETAVDRISGYRFSAEEMAQ